LRSNVVSRLNGPTPDKRRRVLRKGVNPPFQQRPTLTTVSKPMETSEPKFHFDFSFGDDDAEMEDCETADTLVNQCVACACAHQ
jgi:hypothetical protein